MTLETLEKLNDANVVGNNPYFIIADKIKSIRANQYIVETFPKSDTVRYQALVVEDTRRAMHLLKKYGAILPPVVSKLERRQFMSSKGSKDSYANWEVRNGATHQIFTTRKEADSFARFTRKHGIDYAIRHWSLES